MRLFLSFLLGAFLIPIATASPTEENSFPIGLFVPTREDAVVGREVQRGAALAVAERNAAGGAHGVPFRIALASADGTWDLAARELVRVIYEEGARVLLGATDGRSAHLAEQIVTRAHGRVLFITPWATDPTLTQVNVPWFFRLVPDDRAQATSLREAILAEGHADSLALVVEDDYDGRMAADAFAKAAPELASRRIDIRPGASDVDRALAFVSENGAEAIALFASRETTSALLEQLDAAALPLVVYGPLGLLDWPTEEPSSSRRFFHPFDPSTAESRRFAESYLQSYGEPPSLPAAYAYDAAQVLMDAVTIAGNDSKRLEAAIAATDRPGVTGRLRFDENGNRIP